MNTINHLSGAESAARVARYLESECGFGVCSGDPDCRDTQCPGHPCKSNLLTLPVRDSMTGDRLNLHRVDTSQLGSRDGVSFGGCRTDLPIQFADEDEGIGQFLDGIERNAKRFKNIAIAVLAGLLIGAVIYAATK